MELIDMKYCLWELALGLDLVSMQSNFMQKNGNKGIKNMNPHASINIQSLFNFGNGMFSHRNAYPSYQMVRCVFAGWSRPNESYTL